MAQHADIKREHGFHSLRVRQVVQETTDARSFVLEVPSDLTEVFRYRPGQFCTFRVRMGDDEHLRSYSMSSASEVDEHLTVTVKRVPDGLVSNWFHDHVAAGDVLEVTKPSGVFCMRDGGRPLVALCGGSGVTPIMSLVKSALASTQRPVRVLYANRDQESVIFADQLQRLQAAHSGRLEVRHHLDSDAGLLEARTVSDFAASELDTDFYLCGPGGFMDLARTTLLRAGVAPERIAQEWFETAGRTLSGGSAAAAEPATGDPGGEATDEVTVILKGKPTTVAYRPGDTLLETARRGGLQAPFSCESGNCATCMALVHEGAVTMRVNNALTPDEVAEGWVLTCQSIPEGRAVTVEYESF